MSKYAEGAHAASAPEDLTCCVPLAREPLSAADAEGVVQMLKAVAHPTRLRIVSLVLSHAGSEACVCDLLPYFDVSQPTISHHLKVLHEAGILDRERRGTWIYYIARRDALSALSSVFATDAQPTPAGASA